MQTRYLIFRPGQDKPEECVVEFDKCPTYFKLRDLIQPVLDGGKLEHVAVLYEGERRDMFVDEEFVSKALPRNEPATAIYRANWLSKHPDTVAESLPLIAGTAVLFPERQVWF